METKRTNDNPAVRLEAAAETARRMSLVSVSPAESAEFERDLDQLSRDLRGAFPYTDAEIGFDRPATVYIVSDMDPFCSDALVLAGMIRSRPWERHVVLFTTRLENMSFWQEGICQFGGAAIAPDASLGLFDRWLWLGAKLTAFAAQRLVFLAQPGDVVARLAARISTARYGRRLYFSQSRGAICPTDCILSAATHLTYDPLVRRALKSANRNLRVGRLSVPFTPGRDPQERKLPPPPPPPGLGRRAYVHWRVAREKWRLRYFVARVQRRLERSVLAGLIWQARIGLARMRIVTRPSQIVTATAGGMADFRQSGPLAFASVIAEVLRAGGGIHLHLSPVPAPFQDSAHAFLEAAGLDPKRLRFLPKETSVGAAFARHRFDLFIGGFPVDQPGN
ncbi:MAG: hypothetical protein WAU13_06270, partial [Albidovulum sp.]